MSEIKVNKISPKQTCTQLTLGDSGDTIIIPAGATITNNGTATGFGRTGTVNWDTTKKTTGFTAVNGVGYFCDTTSSAFTATLPITPTAGDIVAFSDYTGTWATNNLTLGRNSSNINGTAANLVLNTNNTTATLIYVDATEGWRVIDTGTLSELITPQFVTATGGTVLTCGNFKTHVFTGPGSFVVSCAGNISGSDSVEYLTVAGGGGGGGTAGSNYNGAAGGAGGYRQNYPSPATAGLPVTATTYPITVGAGGTNGNNTQPVSTPGGKGSNSVFSTITSTGGGGGTSGGGSPNPSPSGGSGAGGLASFDIGSGNTPPVSPPQGNNGGSGLGSAPFTGLAGGGGGGAGAVGGAATGTNPTNVTGGAGGIGSPIATTVFGPTSPSYGTPGPAPGRYFAGGGGGGAFGPDTGITGTAGVGGTGGGGTGSLNFATATSGTGNTGGGGGSGGASCGVGGSGGSGIVVIRYKFQ
jgi:hypothetical protein